jgi:TRAP-type C4-dicarboxylate transport system permease small subunit
MDRVFAAVDRVVELLVAVIFAAMCVVGLLQVFNRFILNASLSWSEEAQIFGHIWLVFLAIPIGYRRGAQMHVEAIRRQFPGTVGAVFDLLIECLWAGFAVALTYLSYRVSVVAAWQESPGLEIPMNYPYYGMVVGGAYLLFVALRRIYAWIADRVRRAAP